jgi:apolipoprotein N-acyltransferase
LLGALTVGGYAPFYFFPLPIVTLALLLRLAERDTNAAATLRIGFAFGLGLFGAGVSWVYVSLNVFGAMPAPLAAAVTLAFCAYLALFPAAALFAASRVGAPFLRRVIVFPGAWILAEWLRGLLFTGFPWLSIGYSQAPNSPFAGIAPILGVYGTGLLLVATSGLVASLMAATVNRQRLRHAVAITVIALIAGGLKTIEWTTPSGAPLSVSLLQGNVPQDLKWRPEQVRATLDQYSDMVRASSARLVILPETALPLFLQEVPKPFLDGIAEHARSRGADILIGVPELSEQRGYFNSAVSVGHSPTQKYRKSHLVPFGEFVPLRPLLAPIVEAMAIPLSDFSRGDTAQRPLAIAGERVAVNICYEDVFGDEIIRQLPEASLLVNVSNVAWFGDSIAPMQHLQIAQMRAIETGRYMLRATNTGMTAVIDPRGSVAAVAPTFSKATVTAEVRGYQGATPYVRVGDAAVIVIAAVFAVTPFVRRRRRDRS